jgi:soluble lytic murein transglycosylase-like protein
MHWPGAPGRVTFGAVESAWGLAMGGLRATLVLVTCLAVAGCATDPQQEPEVEVSAAALYPGETRELRRLVEEYARLHEIPASLLHRVIQRESDYNPVARNGPYYGLMQILPETARTMGHRGSPRDLLDAEVNLRYAGRYLRGAWLLSGGDETAAVRRYASGYYYEARDRCMLVETGLLDREVRKSCR